MILLCAPMLVLTLKGLHGFNWAYWQDTTKLTECLNYGLKLLADGSKWNEQTQVQTQAPKEGKKKQK